MVPSLALDGCPDSVGIWVSSLVRVQLGLRWRGIHANPHMAIRDLIARSVSTVPPPPPSPAPPSRWAQQSDVTSMDQERDDAVLATWCAPHEVVHVNMSSTIQPPTLQPPSGPSERTLGTAGSPCRGAHAGSHVASNLCFTSSYPGCRISRLARVR